MRSILNTPPQTTVAPVTEVLHGVPVVDPYRWLEDQESPATRLWLQAQSEYARSYLDQIPFREQIHRRVREFLAVETWDSLLIANDLYVFRKRLPDQEQPCIYLRRGVAGEDQLLLDPAERGDGPYVSVKPLSVSFDGRLLLYEIKRGGERSGTFELMDIPTRRILADKLPHGHLRGFAFSPDSKSFYYVHEPAGEFSSRGRAVYRHTLGENSDDQEIFRSETAGSDLRLHVAPGKRNLGILVRRFAEKTYVDFYVLPLVTGSVPELWLENVDYRFFPCMHDSGRILALTDRDASTLQIVELTRSTSGVVSFQNLVLQTDPSIKGWAVTKNFICVLCQDESETRIDVFDLAGKRSRTLPFQEDATTGLVAAARDRDEVFVEWESFFSPNQIDRHDFQDGAPTIWSKRQAPLDATELRHIRVWFTAKDGVRVPMFLAGRKEVLEGSSRPTIMTSYGGYGISMTPQFSVLVNFMMERGCLFALPGIRGGSEFGVEWHIAAKGRNRQVAFDDFLAAAEWLITTGHTDPKRLAIFGGSNSGLLVGAVMTQRPELFRAAVCMVPMLDMLRYHLFDGARLWKDEFGTSEDPADFAALLGYSPYHRVRDDTAYPATMIISGDADQNCNPMHARKMTARLQAASASPYPVILDYREFRGHSPVLPLSERIAGLTDRLAFLCDQLGLSF